LTSIVIVGIVLALAVVIGYIAYRWGGAETEKATSDELSKMAQNRTAAMERERLRIEYEDRKKETATTTPRPGATPFLPEDKDRLN